MAESWQTVMFVLLHTFLWMLLLLSYNITFPNVQLKGLPYEPVIGKDGRIRRVAWSFFQVRTSTYDLET